MNGFEELSDEELVASAERLAKRERESMAGMVACICEVRRRRALLADLGYAHVFDFCVRRLKMSEGAASRRVAAARAVARYPEALSHLSDGTLTLSALCRVEPYLGEEDAAEILDRASRLDRLALEEFVLGLAERARERAPAPAPDSESPALFPGEASVTQARRPAASDRVAAVAPGRVRISFEATSVLREKLGLAGTLLSNRLRSRRLEELIEALADIVLSRMSPARKGRIRSASTARRVPWSIRREVWERDGGRCAFTAPDGTRCAANRRLQYDHIQPWALGGRSDDAANIRLLCRAHNLHLARKTFGDRVPAPAGSMAPAGSSGPAASA